MSTEETIKNHLLRLLRTDPEVQAAVRDCQAEAEVPMLAPLTEAEAAQIEPVPVISPGLHEDTDALHETIARQERQLEALRRQQAKMQDVLAVYARLESVYGSYLELPPALREPVGSILNDSSPLAFAVTGAKIEVLVPLYELICSVWERCTAAELSALNGCFDLLFDLMLLGDAGYTRIVTHEGEHFDPERHVLPDGCDPEQRIMQVVIAGFEGNGILARSCVCTGAYAFPTEV